MDAMNEPSKALLDSVESELYRIAAKLGELRDKCAEPPYGACAWEISQTMRALGIAVDAVKRTRNPQPLPTLEDVQAIYRKYTNT